MYKLDYSSIPGLLTKIQVSNKKKPQKSRWMGQSKPSKSLLTEQDLKQQLFKPAHSKEAEVQTASWQTPVCYRPKSP